MKVYVVTNPEFGWDCIVGVFNSSNVSLEQLENRFPDDECYFIHENEVEDNLEEYYE